MQIKDPKKTCFALIGVFVVSFACIGILRLSRNIAFTADFSSYDLDWNVFIDNKDYGRQRLSTFVFPHLKRGTTIQLVSTAPELPDIDYMNLELEINDCGVE
ncbi:MAG: hypothetical protein J5505_05165, partial [Spirochaetaceae bacterium]|nr:hypothetical protein [Spirochaetaceae bacterium]